MTDDKVRENRSRRAADRQGFRLVKSRTRDPQAVLYGKYWLIDYRLNAHVFGGEFGARLDEVEEFLADRNRK